jgi:hypothetical protein
MNDQMLHGALNAPYQFDDLNVVQFTNLVDAARRAAARIAQLEAALGKLADDANWFDVFDAGEKFAAWRGEGWPDLIAQAALEGPPMQNSERTSILTGMSLAFDIAMDLASDLLVQKHKLPNDEYYTSKRDVLRLETQTALDIAKKINAAMKALRTKDTPNAD